MGLWFEPILLRLCIHQLLLQCSSLCDFLLKFVYEIVSFLVCTFLTTFRFAALHYLNRKYSTSVTSSRRKNRKAHFGAHSEARHKLMSSNLSKELQARHGVRSMPIRKDDEVLITRGMYKTREGKVTAVYRKKWVVHVERITREKVNGATVPVGIPASSLVITKLKMDKDRKAKLEAKSKNSDGKKEDATMSNVD